MTPVHGIGKPPLQPGYTLHMIEHSYFLEDERKNIGGSCDAHRRRIPLPPGPGILFAATGYPSAKFLDLPDGELQGTYTFVEAPGNPKAIIGRWTVTHSHPTF